MEGKEPTPPVNRMADAGSSCLSSQLALPTSPLHANARNKKHERLRPCAGAQITGTYSYIKITSGIKIEEQDVQSSNTVAHTYSAR